VVSTSEGPILGAKLSRIAMQLLHPLLIALEN